MKTPSFVQGAAPQISDKLHFSRWFCICMHACISIFWTNVFPFVFPCINFFFRWTFLGGGGGGASQPIHPPGSAPDTSTSVRDIPLSMFNQRLRKSLQFTTVNASSLRLSLLTVISPIFLSTLYNLVVTFFACVVCLFVSLILTLFVCTICYVACVCRHLFISLEYVNYIV